MLKQLKKCYSSYCKANSPLWTGHASFDASGSPPNAKLFFVKRTKYNCFYENLVNQKQKNFTFNNIFRSLPSNHNKSNKFCYFVGLSPTFNIKQKFRTPLPPVCIHMAVENYSTLPFTPISHRQSEWVYISLKEWFFDSIKFTKSSVPLGLIN